MILCYALYLETCWPKCCIQNQKERDTENDILFVGNCQRNTKQRDDICFDCDTVVVDEIILMERVHTEVNNNEDSAAFHLCFQLDITQYRGSCAWRLRSPCLPQLSSRQQQCPLHQDPRRKKPTPGHSICLCLLVCSAPWSVRHSAERTAPCLALPCLVLLVLTAHFGAHADKNISPEFVTPRRLQPVSKTSSEISFLKAIFI